MPNDRSSIQLSQYQYELKNSYQYQYGLEKKAYQPIKEKSRVSENTDDLKWVVLWIS